MVPPTANPLSIPIFSASLTGQVALVGHTLRTSYFSHLKYLLMFWIKSLFKPKNSVGSPAMDLWLNSSTSKVMAPDLIQLQPHCHRFDTAEHSWAPVLRVVPL